MASKNSSASTSRPSVLGLFFGRGPRAVPWLVVAVVIDALDALTLWALSHVGKKGVKRLPSFADNNSTGSVAKELVMVRIRGSLNHVLPATIRSRWNSSWAMAVNKESFLYRFFLKTPAGLGVSSSQAFVFDYHSITTCAKAHAVRTKVPAFVSFGWSVLEYFKPSKLFSDDADFRKHDVALSMLCSSGGRPATTGARCDSVLPLLTGGVNA